MQQFILKEAGVKSVIRERAQLRQHCRLNIWIDKYWKMFVDSTNIKKETTLFVKHVHCIMPKTDLYLQ